MADITVCGASAYNRNYYFNPQFDRIPDEIKKRLQNICVDFTKEVGGIFTIDMNYDGTPEFTVRTAQHDTDFSDLEADVRVKLLQESEAELMEELALYYRIFVLHMTPEQLGIDLKDNDDEI